MNPLQRISQKGHVLVFAILIAILATVGAFLSDYILMDATMFWDSRTPSFFTAFGMGFFISYFIGHKLLEINRLTTRLDELASHDFLTGTMTRAKFFSHLSALPSRAGALLVFDMDDFKQINDRLGHAAGDEALSKAVRAARKSLGAQDCLCRMGGDEFCAFLPGIDLEEARLLSDWIKRRITLETVGGGDNTIVLSASFGIATLGDDGDIDEAIAVADADLYQAKADHHGRSGSGKFRARHVRSQIRR